jgi:hypothetical protein
VTHGFELHCNAVIEPNNLEINWEGNRFHLEDLTSAVCTDNPAEDQLPRVAPIDTFDGVGVGRYNGMSGYNIVFRLTDFGEPGSDDIARFHITDPGGATVLLVSNHLDMGNHQAHPENKSPNQNNALAGNQFLRQALAVIAAAVMGDVNADGRFDSSDIVLLFQSGQYEDGVEWNSTWTEGDVNGDQEFDTRDLVQLFQNGRYDEDRDGSSVSRRKDRSLDLVFAELGEEEAWLT